MVIFVLMGYLREWWYDWVSGLVNYNDFDCYWMGDYSYI